MYYKSCATREEVWPVGLGAVLLVMVALVPLGGCSDSVVLVERLSQPGKCYVSMCGGKPSIAVIAGAGGDVVLYDCVARKVVASAHARHGVDGILVGDGSPKSFVTTHRESSAAQVWRYDGKRLQRRKRPVKYT